LEASLAGLSLAGKFRANRTPGYVSHDVIAGYFLNDFCKKCSVVFYLSTGNLVGLF